MIGAEEKKKATSETLVKSFYDSLTEEQRKIMCFAFDHELRLKVDNNWQITKTKVESFTKDQQAMIKEIFMGLHSEEYAQKVYDQVEWDSGIEGFEGGSSVAIFGEPGTGKFEFVLTGRHCTRRCDGDSVEGAAFGGPIFYGHAAKSFNEGPKHEDNAYWYQAVRANEVYQMLDGKQRKAALLGKSRGEHGNKTVELTGKKEGLDGIRVADLSADQKDHVRKVIGDLLAPFRKNDVGRSHEIRRGQRLRQPPPRLLQGREHRRRRGLGRLADRGPQHDLLLPRQTARPRLAAHPSTGMIRAALASALLTAAVVQAAADQPVIEVGQPFPLIKLPVVGKEESRSSLEPYRGRKVMLHLFASW